MGELINEAPNNSLYQMARVAELRGFEGPADLDRLCDVMGCKLRIMCTTAIWWDILIHVKYSALWWGTRIKRWAFFTFSL